MTTVIGTTILGTTVVDATTLVTTVADTNIQATTAIVQDECNPSAENYSYNLSLHIISLFVILVVSLLGASISVVSTRVKRLHISPIIINTGKFFGSG